MQKAERITLARKRLTSILAAHGVATARTLEQKISDAGPNNQRIDPHVLTVVRNAMIEEGEIVRAPQGGVPWFHLGNASPGVTAARLAALLPVYKEFNHGNVSKRVGQLVEAGKIDTRREGKSLLVELASFDRAIGETGDAVKEQAAATVRSQKTARDAAPMRDAQTERAQYEARLKALDLAARQKAILPIAGEHGIDAAAKTIGEALARELDGLGRYADDIAAAVSRDGVAGARRVLKDIGIKIRTSTAKALSTLATQGQDAERDGPIETLLPDE